MNKPLKIVTAMAWALSAYDVQGAGESPPAHEPRVCKTASACILRS